MLPRQKYNLKIQLSLTRNKYWRKRIELIFFCVDMTDSRDVSKIISNQIIKRFQLLDIKLYQHVHEMHCDYSTTIQYYFHALNYY